MMPEIIEQLRKVKELSELPKEQLDWLAQNGDTSLLNPGDTLFKKGEPIEAMHIILDGRVSVKLEQNNQFREVGEMGPFEITGLLPYSRANKATGIGQAVIDTHVLTFKRPYIQKMIKMHPELTEVLVHKMTSRVREFTSQRLHDEKLLSLGKLSAGLAHELNNPASAVVRSANALRKHLHLAPDKFKRVMALKLNDKQIDTVNHVLFSKLDQKTDREIGLLEKTEIEDELANWLEDHGIEDGFEHAEILSEFGFDVGDLNEIHQVIAENEIEAVVGWLNNVLTTEKMVGEIEEASQRIAGLVGSIKTYTHMDQAPDKQKTDVRKGIESTLTMLAHKMKRKDISIRRDFPEALPQINGFVSELNQVWTNIIDNAIDAMNNNGTLEIAASQDREFVLVSIIDDGKGIPEEIQSRIFDPFFTTKDMEEGTGLGLDIVQKIIRKHNGEIKVFSKTGRTEFRLCFPVD